MSVELTLTQSEFKQLVLMHAIDLEEVCIDCGHTFGKHRVNSTCLGIKKKVEHLSHSNSGG